MSKLEEVATTKAIEQAIFQMGLTKTECGWFIGNGGNIVIPLKTILGKVRFKRAVDYAEDNSGLYQKGGKYHLGKFIIPKTSLPKIIASIYIGGE